MAISGVTTDYTGRKRDISILQYPNAQLEDAQTVFPKFGKNARFCAGVQKLIQRYTIILLTNLKSQEKYPEFGTEFLYTLKAGIDPLDSGGAAHIFSLANFEAVSLIKADQAIQEDIPLDEQLQSASLVNIRLYGDSILFNVQITTEAGDTQAFTIPLPK